MVSCSCFCLTHLRTECMHLPSSYFVGSRFVIFCLIAYLVDHLGLWCPPFPYLGLCRCRHQPYQWQYVIECRNRLLASRSLQGHMSFITVGFSHFSSLFFMFVKLAIMYVNVVFYMCANVCHASQLFQPYAVDCTTYLVLLAHPESRSQNATDLVLDIDIGFWFHLSSLLFFVSYHDKWCVTSWSNWLVLTEYACAGLMGLCVRPNLVGWLLMPPGLAMTTKSFWDLRENPVPET